MKNLFFVLGALLAACSQNSNDTASSSSSSDGASFSLGVEELVLKHNDCDSTDCTTVEWKLPILEGGESALSEKINANIRSEFLSSSLENVSEGESASDFEGFAQLFFDAYSAVEADFPDSPVWYFELDGSQSQLLGDTVLALKLTSHSFMGGAHGNVFTQLLNIDLKNGQPIDLESLYGEAIREIAEIKFRSFHGVAPDAELNDQGFIFPEEGFVLPENMGYYEDGILLYYNAYEVAPYVMGPTELKISFSELSQSEA
jgi:hypothetical protein